MDLLSLKMKSIRTQLDYLRSDYEYKQTMVEQGDKEFLKMMNEVLDENPELKKMYIEKEEKKKDDLIKEAMDNAKKEEDEYQKEHEEVPEEEDPIEGESEPEEDPIEDIEEDLEPTPESEKSKKIKKLYRQIVKLTHPDKIEDEKLNELYVESTDYYNNENLYGIYKICDILDIEYEIEESEVNFMDTEITTFKKKINFIEGTYTWKWSTAPSENIKKQVVIEFINMKLNS
ncbi:MAG: hypothetical protein SLAVMIC_00457 [uncultured marine phage]|uniref:J domain-containing protein n=1 Tax=uncultured marine phage TaxID=707152 RepID=A0A8D9CF77_9VIRU|nr:MAG: hypothetical protein SLAVMIC_00457 [uncultured marine phage]